MNNLEFDNSEIGRVADEIYDDCVPKFQGQYNIIEHPMIEVRNLTKAYKDVNAVDDVSFQIGRGEVFGFIGPNGAGKTTTIRILATLLDPDSGEAFIDGVSVVDDPEEVRKNIGFMPDYFGIYDGMKVWEYLDFFSSAYGISKHQRKEVISDVLELTDLTLKKDAFIEALSKGMKQRLCAAKTLLNDPKVLILDEPAAGLDPRARIELKELLKELSRMEKTIFISSHILPELSDFCSRIGIIEAGKILACGKVDEFTQFLGLGAAKRTIKIRALAENSLVEEALKSIENVRSIRQENSGYMVDFSGGTEDLAEMLETLVKRNIKVVEFSEKSVDLEDVFMKITKGEVA